MGSRYRRKSDGRWVAQISTGPRGNRSYLVRYAKTRKEADLALDDLRKLVRPAEGGGRTTVGQYLRAWLDSAGVRSLKPSTWRTYDVALRKHIEPAVGHVALARLTAEQVDTMLAGLSVNGPKTEDGKPTRIPMDAKGQRNVLGFLGRVLDVAEQRGHVLRNAARLVEPPRVIRQDPAVLDAVGARRVMAAVAGDRLEALWISALGSGLRQGELLGLQWSDVDLERATVTVQNALVRIPAKRGSDQVGRYLLDDPKTARSRRMVALPEFVIASLRAHRARQLEERVGSGKSTTDGLVFVSAPGHRSKQDPEGIGGRPLNGGWVSHRWRTLSRAAGVDVTFHGLRHTNATILRDRGIPEDVRMGRLGHTTTGMARKYAHATDAPDRAAAVALEEALA